MENTFVSDVVEFIKEGLEYLEGNTYEDATDLAYTLTEDENCTGAWIIGTWRALEYIGANVEHASYAFEYERDNFGQAPNPFDTPEGFTVHMLIWGVTEALYSCDTITCANEIELTPETIAAITDDLDDVNFLTY